MRFFYTPSMKNNSFELSFDPVYIHTLMANNPWIPILAISVYGMLLFVGQRYFRHRPSWDWSILMSLWHLSLCIFSTIGVIRITPVLVRMHYHFSLRDNFCFNPEHYGGGGSTGLWGMLFVLFKFPELIDTFFITIHKKPLLFAHWYHHMTVLLYCWHSWVTRAPTSIIFCVMNYAVHTMVHLYHFLKAAKCKPKFFHAIHITILIVIEMFFGIAVTAYGCYLLWFTPQKINPTTCWLRSDNMIAAMIMYASYFLLFLHVLYTQYQLYRSKRESSLSLDTKSNGQSSTNGYTHNKSHDTYAIKIKKIE
jgi:elongation of very long chain fatty acids protein 6